MDTMRSIIIERSLLKTFREKAVNSALYPLNRCPTKACKIRHLLKLGMEQIFQQMYISEFIVGTITLMFYNKNEVNMM